MPHIIIKHWINNRDYEALYHFFMIEVLGAFVSGFGLCYLLVYYGVITI